MTLPDSFKDFEYYNILFEEACKPMLVINDDFFVDANRAALEIMHFSSKEELYAIHPAQISPMYQPDGKLSQTKAESIFRSCNEKGHSNFEWLHKRLDGSTFSVEVTLKTLNIKDNKLVLVSWIELNKNI